MSQVDIVHLEAYRGRRAERFRRALALSRPDRNRSRLLEHLWQAVSVAGGDRGAVVWLDEYGPGLAHPHTVLDLATDHPRRSFSAVPLRAAWETRVPGLLDIPQPGGRWGGLGEGVASFCAVSLGSDGPRSWFLVVDSLTPRVALSEEAAGYLMFLAGETASIILHRDLDLRETGRKTDSGGGGEDPSSRESASFPAWPVLQDLEGRQRNDRVTRRIGNRFLVARVVRALVDEEVVSEAEAIAHQVRNVRNHLGTGVDLDGEEEAWERALQAVEGGDLEELTNSLLVWGRLVEEQGHLHGALEILWLAYELARATGSADSAADAARFQGKVFRTRAEWGKALEWYEVARGIAEGIGDSRKTAAVLDGLANVFRDRGNLPRARELLDQVLAIGRETGDRYAMAIGHHDLMTVEKLSGNLVSAIQNGWMAVQSYDSREGSLRALFDLSGVLREGGELRAARDGYTVVAEGVAGFEYRLLSLDALAYIAALAGDVSEHDAVRARMEEAGWRDLSPVYLGQVLLFRGLANRALGLEGECRKWLEEALAFAEEHGLNKMIFDVERALAGDPPAGPWPQAPDGDSTEPCGAEIYGVRHGLRELREALAGAE